MRIAVLGAGMVGQAMAAGLAQLGHEVMVGTRDPEATLARRDPDQYGNPPFSAWKETHPEVAAVSLSDAGGAELIINATNGAGSIAALEAVGEEQLRGKVVLDIANPIDPSAGMPPSLSVSNTDSLGEQIQRRFPDARVVKALNTLSALLMANPEGLAAGDHTVFISGDDPDAKSAVTGLLESLGWSDIIDLGDIGTARGPEMYFALWFRLWMALGTPIFSIKVVR